MSASGRSLPSARPLRILFTTSNGTGLGHLTRSMAIARRLEPAVEPLFLTLSAAAPVHPLGAHLTVEEPAQAGVGRVDPGECAELA